MPERRTARWPRFHRRPAFAGLVVVLGLTFAVPLAWAQMTDLASSDTQSLSTSSLVAPTGPGTALGTCSVLGGGDTIIVSWTMTTSTWADGYEILRSLTSGGPYTPVGTAAGQATQSFADSALALSTTFHYVVEATRGNWRSAQTAEVSGTTRSVLSCGP